MERHDATDITVNVDHDPQSKLYSSSLRLFWPRLVATCMGWVANDFGEWTCCLYCMFVCACATQLPLHKTEASCCSRWHHLCQSQASQHTP